MMLIILAQLYCDRAYCSILMWFWIMAFKVPEAQRVFRERLSVLSKVVSFLGLPITLSVFI